MKGARLSSIVATITASSGLSQAPATSQTESAAHQQTFTASQSFQAWQTTSRQVSDGDWVLQLEIRYSGETQALYSLVARVVPNPAACQNRGRRLDRLDWFAQLEAASSLHATIAGRRIACSAVWP